ncbi:MAG TPA: hypothetical protein VL614_15285 [Acetobacteraceae bacterium]|jgi:hypothetical protein|nr:hypothetical protein [Acetobacteraceae bacterium]
MSLHLHHPPSAQQQSLPFSAMDAMAMMGAISTALDAAASTKAMGAKVPSFLDELHRHGYTVTAVPADVEIPDAPVYTPGEGEAAVNED